MTPSPQELSERLLAANEEFQALKKTTLRTLDQALAPHVKDLQARLRADNEPHTIVRADV